MDPLIWYDRLRICASAHRHESAYDVRSVERHELARECHLPTHVTAPWVLPVYSPKELLASESRKSTDFVLFSAFIFLSQFLAMNAVKFPAQV